MSNKSSQQDSLPATSFNWHTGQFEIIEPIKTSRQFQIVMAEIMHIFTNFFDDEDEEEEEYQGCNNKFQLQRLAARCKLISRFADEQKLDFGQDSGQDISKAINVYDENEPWSGPQTEDDKKMFERVQDYFKI